MHAYKGILRLRRDSLRSSRLAQDDSGLVKRLRACLFKLRNKIGCSIPWVLDQGCPMAYKRIKVKL